MPSGTPPSPRYAHAAAVFGSDLLVFGGLPPARGSQLELLNLVDVEMQTSAPIARRLATDGALNASCALLLGSEGSPTQRYACNRRPSSDGAAASAVAS